MNDCITKWSLVIILNHLFEFILVHDIGIYYLIDIQTQILKNWNKNQLYLYRPCMPDLLLIAFVRTKYLFTVRVLCLNTFFWYTHRNNKTAKQSFGKANLSWVESADFFFAKIFDTHFFREQKKIASILHLQVHLKFSLHSCFDSSNENSEHLPLFLSENIPSVSICYLRETLNGTTKIKCKQHLWLFSFDDY